MRYAAHTGALLGAIRCAALRRPRHAACYDHFTVVAGENQPCHSQFASVDHTCLNITVRLKKSGPSNWNIKGIEVILMCVLVNISSCLAQAIIANETLLPSDWTTDTGHIRSDQQLRDKQTFLVLPSSFVATTSAVVWTACSSYCMDSLKQLLLTASVLTQQTCLSADNWCTHLWSSLQKQLNLCTCAPIEEHRSNSKLSVQHSMGAVVQRYACAGLNLDDSLTMAASAS